VAAERDLQEVVAEQEPFLEAAEEAQAAVAALATAALAVALLLKPKMVQTALLWRPLRHQHGGLWPSCSLAQPWCQKKTAADQSIQRNKCNFTQGLAKRRNWSCTFPSQVAHEHCTGYAGTYCLIQALIA
jgi:hypothetical protein